jgi:hypothetical protein
MCETRQLENCASHSSCEERAYLGGCTVGVGREFLVKKMLETKQLEIGQSLQLWWALTWVIVL